MSKTIIAATPNLADELKVLVPEIGWVPNGENGATIHGAWVQLSIQPDRVVFQVANEDAVKIPISPASPSPRNVALVAKPIIDSVKSQVMRDARARQFIDGLEVLFGQSNPQLQADVRVDPFSFLFVLNQPAVLVKVSGIIGETGPIETTIGVSKMPAGMSEAVRPENTARAVLHVTEPSQVIPVVMEMYRQTVGEVEASAKQLFKNLLAWHRAYYRVIVLNKSFDPRAEQPLVESKADFYALSEQIGGTFLKMIDNWLSAHEHYAKPEIVANYKTVKKMRNGLARAMTDLTKIDKVASALTLAINVAHRNGKIMEALGLTEVDFAALNNLGSHEKIWAEEIKNIGQ